MTSEYRLIGTKRFGRCKVAKLIVVVVRRFVVATWQWLCGDCDGIPGYAIQGRDGRDGRKSIFVCDRGTLLWPGVSCRHWSIDVRRSCLPCLGHWRRTDSVRSGATQRVLEHVLRRQGRKIPNWRWSIKLKVNNVPDPSRHCRTTPSRLVNSHNSRAKLDHYIQFQQCANREYSVL